MSSVILLGAGASKGTLGEQSPTAEDFGECLKKEEPDWNRCYPYLAAVISFLEPRIPKPSCWRYIALRCVALRNGIPRIALHCKIFQQIFRRLHFAHCDSVCPREPICDAKWREVARGCGLPGFCYLMIDEGVMDVKYPRRIRYSRCIQENLLPKSRYKNLRMRFGCSEQ